ncbi:MAG: RNA polymerase sigma factor [Flavobacteriales bacterium]
MQSSNGAYSGRFHMNQEQLDSEKKLIETAKQNPVKFQPLYERYYEGVFRFVYKRMDDKELAADIVSQVFLKAMINLCSYTSKGVPFGSWLFAIARSEIYQAFRNQKSVRIINVDSMHVFEMLESDESGDDQLNSDRLKEVVEELRNLQEDDLMIVEMKYFEKRSYKEIGEILGITENNAKVRSHRILERIKKKVENNIRKNE